MQTWLQQRHLTIEHQSSSGEPEIAIVYLRHEEAGLKSDACLASIRTTGNPTYATAKLLDAKSMREML